MNRISIVLAALVMVVAISASTSSVYAAAPGQGVDINAMLKKANEFHQNKEYDKAIALLSNIMKFAEMNKEQIPEDQYNRLAQNCYYNIACAQSLLKKNDEALTALEKAVGFGWADAEHMKKDTDLDSIRETDRYKKIIAKIEAGADGTEEKEEKKDDDSEKEEDSDKDEEPEKEEEPKEKPEQPKDEWK